VTFGSASEGYLHVGDRIKRINNVDVSASNHSDILHLVKASGNKLGMLIER
jgi:hypothetical protein